MSVRATGSGQGTWVGLTGKVPFEKRKFSPPAGGKTPVWVSGRSMPVDPGSAWRRKPELGEGQDHEGLCVTSLGLL